MANCGIQRIDSLLGGAGASPIVMGDPDRDAVGVVQDFLTIQGFKGLPGPLGNARGLFGPATESSVRAFRQSNGMAPAGQVDSETMRKLVSTRGPNPLACRGYLTLVLDRAFDDVLRVMSITCQFEGAGRFAAANRNTDRAGLSFGIIQWAQKPGRLAGLLRAFDNADHQLFVTIFGGGQPDLAQGLIAHTSRVQGGVDDHGETVDPNFDLIESPWIDRFRASALEPKFQGAQVDTAVAAFRASLAKIRNYAPQIRSERAVAFMLDLANQHGDGGARSIFQAVAPAPDEPALLKALEDESVERIADQFGGDSAEAIGSRARREAFRTTPLLANTPAAGW